MLMKFRTLGSTPWRGRGAQVGRLGGKAHAIALA
jgi:hypothetical protein